MDTQLVWTFGKREESLLESKHDLPVARTDVQSFVDSPYSGNTFFPLQYDLPYAKVDTAYACVLFYRMCHKCEGHGFKK